MSPNKWEVWLVNMPFEEGIGSKVRPALVLDPQRYSVIVGKMTSHEPRRGYSYEYQLRDWHGAGLSLPTTLRLSQRPALDSSRFLRKLGRIQPVDMVQILVLLNQIANDN